MTSLPSVPVEHAKFLSYIRSKPSTPIEDLVKPFNEYDEVARQIFAQEPSHPLAKDNHANIVPIFGVDGSAELKIRARDLASETPEEADKYLMPLDKGSRKENGSPAVVPSFKEFQDNFTIFTEGALSDIDWSNTVAAGSAVVTSLLPVPEKYRGSKRGLRQYYHEEFAPASDVDIFLYGMTEEQAIEKIRHIEDRIRNTILYETTTIRTKHTITIVSQYPTRHVQIVLRIYKSVAEILTGFDVDCSCVAYDGTNVYAAPRAIASYITQKNQVDLTRRSPSYENRLSKYSRRGFEIYWSKLDRSKVDPTIFERSFTRTEGLARLLVLEKLPKASHREAYMQQRRKERGRPPVNIYLRRRKELRGNIKQDWEDEVPEWQEEDQVSNYHTFTIPYGQRFNARKIEKLVYTRDLLLNAEWNQPKDRPVYLHRHPAFFGEVEHVIGDCCGFCPQPTTEEEKKIAEEESKTYISGKISFIKDDPGRQEIGSFNPITDTDWTEMAYIGGTERLCQAIVSEDVDAVNAFLAEENTNVDCRDYTGRTPLQLACMSSSPEVVQCLVDHGARLIARMADGRTALHIAAARGRVEIIRILLTKSNQNEEEEAAKDSSRKTREGEKTDDSEEGVEKKDADDMSRTSASFVKIDHEDAFEEGDEALLADKNELEPDIYDINAISWDSLTSPLHLAIIHGHTETVKELVTSFGADVMLPIKHFDSHGRKPLAATLTLVLVLSLPLDKAREMSQALLEVGASLSQADFKQNTALNFIVQSDYSELIDIYMKHDGPATQRAIKHMTIDTWHRGFFTPLMHAINAKKEESIQKLIQAGAKIHFDQADFLSTMKSQLNKNDFLLKTTDTFIETHSKQPIIAAVENQLPLVALELLRWGADPNSEQMGSYYGSGYTNFPPSPKDSIDEPPFFHRSDEEYLQEFQQDSYKAFSGKAQLREAHRNLEQTARDNESRKRRAREQTEQPKVLLEKAHMEELVRNYELLETELVRSGAKLWRELHPEPDQNQKLTKSPVPPKPESVPEFRFEFNFNIPPLNFNSPTLTLTDELRAGYLELFEAAWRGDLHTIKKLTLGMWGPAQDQPPLEIAVCDQYGFSCPSIAILRGHLQVSEEILGILKAQYKEKTGPRQRLEMRSDDYSDDESDSDSNHDGLDVVGREVDDQFTYENVGQVVTDVESSVSPLAALQKSCSAHLFLDEWPEIQRTVYIPADTDYPNCRKFNVCSLTKYAIVKNDISLLNFLLKTRQKCQVFSTHSTPDLLHDDFQLAISLSRIDCLTSLIQKAAVGLPLQKLAEQSGCDTEEKYKYYPGLSIRGKKRKDWASAGRGEIVMEAPEGRPPLLIAAMQGKITVVEWFLSTAPGRHYVEYVSSHMEDEHVQKLARSKLGLEGSILNWLQTRNNLVLHCAIISKPSEESERLVKFLGLPPLALAFSIRRFEFACILIGAGANQTTRDREGHNLLHLLLKSSFGSPCKSPDEITRFSGLLDQQLLTAMLVERASGSSNTPLFLWMGLVADCQAGQLHYKASHKPEFDVLNILLDLGSSNNQRHLEMLDGSGNTPVHMAVEAGWPRFLELMLDRRPDLLYRENATGVTPFDMAVDSWTNSKTLSVPNVKEHRYPTYKENPYGRSTISYHPDFDPRSKQDVIYQICRDRAQQFPGKRRLVSLYDANEVSKRLAAIKRSCLDDYGGEDDDTKDEVDIWGRNANIL
ncbi:hypothetical protein N7470_008518 [Penicillium chermesinum]|nr:hypothetical protein N7470_008518 [Penicillium chermesinum]